MEINWAEIQPAQWLGPPKCSSQRGFHAMELRFKVPLCHTLELCQHTVELHAELVYGPGPPIVSPVNAAGNLYSILQSICPPNDTRSIVVYLCGGPGDENPAFANLELLKILLAWGHPVLFLDYRGTGKSQRITTERLRPWASPDAYLAQFRQDSIVADLEAIRMALNNVKFSLIGQSFGGWIAMTYVSFLPTALNGVFLAGGLPPIGKGPRDVYAALYQRMVEANKTYYAQYPEDVAKVRRIFKWLASQTLPGCNGITLPDGQLLTPRGFMTQGRHFGRGQAGFERVHLLVTRMAADLAEGGEHKSPQISDETLADYLETGGAGFRLNERPLYAALHEAIYCSGQLEEAPNWAAHEVGKLAGPEFKWLYEWFEDAVMHKDPDDDSGPLYFTGEMIHDFMLREAGKTTVLFDKAADMLAKKRQWTPLYDAAQLRRNLVPIRAVVYPNDLFVDETFSLRTAGRIKTCQAVKPPPEWLHGSIKTRPREVCGLLFSLKKSFDDE